MKHDNATNLVITDPLAANAGSHTVGAHNGTSVDLVNAPGVSFVVSCYSLGTGGTGVLKAQSSPDDSTWADDTAVGTVDIAVGVNQLDVTRALDRYYRCVLTVGTDTITGGATQVVGPVATVHP